MSKFSVSAVIMAHEKRAAFIPELQARLDREVPVIWDEKNDRWDTGARAMRAYDPEASHHLVIQDDAVLTANLIAGVERALEYVPSPEKTPLALYLGRNKPFRHTMNVVATKSEQLQASWVKMTQIHWGVGIVFPTNLIDEMVTWCDTRSEIPNYDRRISRWVGHKHLDVYYPWPSLVDHRDSPSLVEGRTGKGRRAHRFLGENASALDHKWDGPVIEIKSLNRYQQDIDAQKARRAAKRPSHSRWTRY